MSGSARYVVMKAYNLEDLQNDVNELLAKGWRLVGGISFGADRSGFTLFCQAMTNGGKHA